ncbi:MAG: T9SS type A sorting domain-containing protein [Cytophagaceae bacterium]|nr:T9SS type A sorting domain-containing protein [Cytophagaceae bacterium]
MTLPKTGLQLLTSNEIFNYASGDEFHYEIVLSNPPYGTSDDTKEIRRVINVRISQNTDTVIYKMRRFREINHIDFTTENQTLTYRADTIIETYILNQPIFYPNQAITELDINAFIDQKRYSSYVYEINVVDYNNRAVFLPSAYPIYIGDCFRSIIDAPNPDYRYVSGLGLAWRSNDDYLSPQQDHTFLTYYKKGSEVWGVPLILSTYLKATKADLSLFPNPLKQGETLHLSTDHFNAVQVMIYNGTGNRVLESVSNPMAMESIDVSKLQPGLYVVQLLNEKNEFITSKLIIK